MSYHLNTKRGYSFPAVSSAMQKAIRRGDAKLAGYWALELWTSGFGQYVWRCLLTVSAEDCHTPHLHPFKRRRHQQTQGEPGGRFPFPVSAGEVRRADTGS